MAGGAACIIKLRQVAHISELPAFMVWGGVLDAEGATNFSMPGDSGAWVQDNSAVIVGVVAAVTSNDPELVLSIMTTIRIGHARSRFRMDLRLAWGRMDGEGNASRAATGGR